MPVYNELFLHLRIYTNHGFKTFDIFLDGFILRLAADMVRL